jgi:hypothetical protein
MQRQLKASKQFSITYNRCSLSRRVKTRKWYLRCIPVYTDSAQENDIGCTSVDGLRIINFKDEVCLPHPETVELFCSRTCLDPDPDLKCYKFAIPNFIQTCMSECMQDFILLQTINVQGRK